MTDQSADISTTSPLPRWADVPREAVKLEWSMTNARAGLLCLPVIGVWIFIAVGSGKAEQVVLAVAGAVAVGFGAFQHLARSRLWPMVITLLGIAGATWAGSVSGHVGWMTLTVVAAAAGYLFGAVTLLGYGAWWIGLQWMIALLVYGAHPAASVPASRSAMEVLLGGGTQLLFLSAVGPLVDHWFRKQARPPLDVSDSIGQTFLRNLDPRTREGRYAMRVSIAIALATLVNHYLGFANGYWTPMTAAILLRPEFHETRVRVLSRIIGTLAGAGLTSLLIALFQPGVVERRILLLLAIWGCFTLQRVNYALFATCITAYVVLLLSTIGLPEPIVAIHRIEATLIGAAIAMIAHTPRLRAAT